MSQQNSKIQPSNGWAVAAGLRLPIPPNKERGVFFRSISGISRFFGRPELPNIFPVINTNRRLFWAWLFFASRLMPFGRLPARTRELVILRVAFNCRSRYEFAQHLEIAQRLGVNDQDILATTKPAEQCAEQHLQALLLACDCVCKKQPINDQVWQTLRQHYSDKLLIELLMLIGHYQLVAAVLINAAVPIEKDIEANLVAFELKTGSESEKSMPL